jgi:hypothetical protein
MRALLAIALCGSAGIAHADPTYTCKEAAPTQKLSVSFKPEVAVQDLVLWVAGFSCKNIVIAPDVPKYATKMTIVAPKQMTPKQAMQLFVDALEAAGLVVQQKPDTILIKLGPNMPKTCPDLKAAPSTPPTTTQVPAVVESDETEARVIAGIKRISDAQVEITRAAVDEILSNPMPFVKGARVVPAIKDGKPAGMKIYAIRPSSLVAKVGLANGDTLLAINGIELNSPEQALDLYTKVRTAKKLDLSLVRRGTPMTLTILIK